MGLTGTIISGQSSLGAMATKRSKTGALPLTVWCHT